MTAEDTLPEVAWTIKNAEDYAATVAAGRIPVFEQITPEELEKLVR